MVEDFIDDYFPSLILIVILGLILFCMFVITDYYHAKKNS